MRWEPNGNVYFRSDAVWDPSWDDVAMDKLITVSMSEVHESPLNPRKDFGNVEDLASKIESQGLIEPVILRKRESGGYWVVAGARRTRALKRLGRKKTEAILREYTDEQALAVAIAENVERESLNPLEVASGYQALMDMGQTAEQVAESQGIGKSSVYNATSLLKLPAPVKQAIASGKISGEAARPITSVQGERLQLQAFAEVMKLAKGGEPPSSRAAFRLIRDKYLTTAKKGLSKKQKEVRAHGADVALRRRVVTRLLARALEALVSRKPHLPDEALRFMASGLAEAGDESVREVFQRRGLRPDRLSKVAGSQLRELVADLCWAPAVKLVDGEYPAFAKALAKTAGVSLGELERNVQNEAAADALFEKAD